MGDRGSIPGRDRPKSCKQVVTNSSIAKRFTTGVSGSIMKFPLLKTDGGKVFPLLKTDGGKVLTHRFSAIVHIQKAPIIGKCARFSSFRRKYHQLFKQNGLRVHI